MDIFRLAKSTHFPIIIPCNGYMKYHEEVSSNSEYKVTRRFRSDHGESG